MVVIKRCNRWQELFCTTVDLIFNILRQFVEIKRYTELLHANILRVGVGIDLAFLTGILFREYPYKKFTKIRPYCQACLALVFEDKFSNKILVTKWWQMGVIWGKNTPKSARKAVFGLFLTQFCRGGDSRTRTCDLLHVKQTL